jgi:glucokinase
VVAVNVAPAGVHVGPRGVVVALREVFATQATLGAAHLRGHLAETLAAFLLRLRSEQDVPDQPPVGISVPELVDLDGLVVTEVVVPGLAGDLKRWAEIGIVHVESDVRAAAHAEARAGAGTGFPSFAYMSIGTGISSAFVRDGAAWPGAHGAAILLGSGPFGPKLRPDGRPYPLEDLASGPAMVAAYRELGGRAASAREVLDRYDDDPIAARVVEDAASSAGQGVALLVNVLDPHAMIIGGGLGCVEGPYWRILETSARDHIWAEAARHVPLLRSGLGPDAAAIGAALGAATAELTATEAELAAGFCDSLG